MRVSPDIGMVNYADRAMKFMAQLIKDDQVVDTYIVEAASQDDLAEGCCKAFDYFIQPPACLMAMPMCASSSKGSMAWIERGPGLVSLGGMRDRVLSQR